VSSALTGQSLPPIQPRKLFPLFRLACIDGFPDTRPSVQRHMFRSIPSCRISFHEGCRYCWDQPTRRTVDVEERSANGNGSWVAIHQDSEVRPCRHARLSIRFYDLGRIRSRFPFLHAPTSSPPFPSSGRIGKSVLAFFRGWSRDHSQTVVTENSGICRSNWRDKSPPTTVNASLVIFGALPTQKTADAVTRMRINLCPAMNRANLLA